MLHRFENYLCNRKQFTVVNKVSSTLSDIVCGVPQGSVLGPLLFLLYVNDLPNVISDHKLKLFADDTNLFISGRTFADLEMKANACLNKMHCWFIANRLSLNIEKTCFTIFSPQRRADLNPPLNLVISNQRILQVESCKYLGVIIDAKLSWKPHI
jgi:ribonuclease P/MRP protein subunit RPP40